MTSTLFGEQQALLSQQLQILQRIEEGARYSLARLPQPIMQQHLSEPEVVERIAALNDRCTKMQDQLAGAMKHAHAMLGERYRSYNDVVMWAVSQGVLGSAAEWLELRALRNRLTHDYDLEAEPVLALIIEMRSSVDVLGAMATRLSALCNERGLVAQKADRG